MSGAGSLEIRWVDGRVDAGDGGRLEAAMRAEVGALYDGLDLTAAHMPRAGAAELNPPHGVFLVGYVDAEAICCGGIKVLEPGVCEFKRMYVVPGWRGRGVGRRLLSALEARAVAMGFAVARMDTGDRQPDAQHLYRSAGYVEIPNFNANNVATWFGEKRLV